MREAMCASVVESRFARRHTPPELSPSKTRPRVLVLLASFNGAAWVDRQLDSILQQQEVDVSVVVRDDCSTDHTVSVLMSTAKRGHVRIVSASQPTGSASQNFFSLVRDNLAQDVDFVAFADQDDEWHVDKLKRACEELVRTGAVGYSSPVIAVWENGRSKVLKPGRGSHRSDYLFEGGGQGCTYVLTSAFFRKARQHFIEHAELTEGIVFHDWAIYALARAWQLPWLFDSKPTMHYRQHAGNSIGARSSMAGIWKRIYLIRTGWYGTQLRYIARLCASANPSDGNARDWLQLLDQKDTLRKRWSMARFCLTHGRRSRAHRIVLALAALAGWL